MQLNSIEDIIEDFRLGKPVILMDDEDRENEGDLIVAAEKITPEIVNFMVTEARGLLCMPMFGDRCDFLGLPPMVSEGFNASGYKTPFTVSIEAAEGVTTGISAHDRATTIRVAADPTSHPCDIVQPGHVFPLRAQPGGVLSRAGHTEAACDLARIAGLSPVAAIVEIMNDDGSMARRTDLEVFAQKHELKIGTIADLIHYRMLNEQTVIRQEKKTLNTDHGQFDMIVYHDSVTGRTHLALSKGYITPKCPTLVRVHVMEPFRDLLSARNEENEASWSLHNALAKVAKEGRGVIVFLDIGDNIELGAALSRFDDKTRYKGSFGAYTAIGTGSQILRDIGVGKMRLLSNPVKFAALSGFGLEVTEYIQYE